MAPEILKGHYQSTPKIDIWSLGLMLHGLVFGFLPFNSPDKATLEKQIINDELDYQNIKRLRTVSIKNEKRKALNLLLRNLSDDLIDLIDKMVQKDPTKRIDILNIYEHPWIVKYKHKFEKWSDDEKSISTSSINTEKSLKSNNEDNYSSMSSLTENDSKKQSDQNK